MDFNSKILLNVARLKVLRDLSLIDNYHTKVFDRITEIAGQAIDAPVSLVSMVAADYQFFKSHTGLPEPWKSKRRTPLSHSFCQHVVTSNEPLVVSDAREVPKLKDNLAIPDLSVIGYLGMPLTLSDGKSLGSFCVIDSEPREWTNTEIAIVREFSELITYEIDMRAMVYVQPNKQHQLEEARETINNILDQLNPELEPEAFLDQLRAARVEFKL